jgi:ankyrin repeat protein
MEAAQNGDTALTNYLLAHGADPTLTSDEGQTAADFAINSGHTDLATELRSK